MMTPNRQCSCPNKPNKENGVLLNRLSTNEAKTWKMLNKNKENRMVLTSYGLSKLERLQCSSQLWTAIGKPASNMCCESFSTKLCKIIKDCLQENTS